MSLKRCLEMQCTAGWVGKVGDNTLSFSSFPVSSSIFSFSIFSFTYVGGGEGACVARWRKERKEGRKGGKERGKEGRVEG